MAIKIQPVGTIPEIQLDHIQYDQLRISVGDEPPYKIALSAKCRLYGVGPDGLHYYDKKVHTINIADVSVYIANLPASKQAKAGEAMAKLQEALGTVAEIYLGLNFETYE